MSSSSVNSQNGQLLRVTHCDRTDASLTAQFPSIPFHTSVLLPTGHILNQKKQGCHIPTLPLRRSIMGGYHDDGIPCVGSSHATTLTPHVSPGPVVLLLFSFRDSFHALPRSWWCGVVILITADMGFAAFGNANANKCLW